MAYFTDTMLTPIDKKGNPLAKKEYAFENKPKEASAKELKKMAKELFKKA